MAHELDFTTGAAAIAYRGETPWHGYGQRIDEDLPLEQWRPLAGLDWAVTEHPLYINRNDEGTSDKAGRLFGYTRVPSHKALVRDDTRDQLSIVSKGYKVVQPKEVLDFFEELIANQGFKMHTAGALAGGNRIWALAETGRDFVIPGSEDQLGAYLLLATSYDAKFATTAQYTSVRVVCNNTLTFSLDGDGKQSVKIPHNADFDADAVKRELGLLDGGFTRFKENVIKLADVKISKKQAVEFFLELLGVTEEEAAEGKQILNTKKLISFYEQGPGADFVTAKNTTWGLVNAVTYFTDHGRRAHNNGTRMNSAWFGEGARLKAKAYDKALRIAEAA